MAQQTYIQAAGKTPDIASMHLVALYNAKDGRIVHMHHALTLEGAQLLKREEHERNARAYAERLGHDVGSVRALHVPDFRPTGKHYRVDVEKQALVELSLPGRKKRR